MLFGKNIDGVLHGISSDNDAVIGLCVAGMISLAAGASRGLQLLRGFDIAEQQHTNGHLDNFLRTCFLVPIDFVDSNVIFAIAGCGEVDHGSCGGKRRYNQVKKTRRVLELSREQLLSEDDTAAAA